MTSATRLLLRDELIGFAKSKVMLVLWLVLPCISLLGYLLLPAEAFESGAGVKPLTATAFMAFIVSNIAGTLAGIMVAVDIVSEKNRKVYELYVIRPIRPEAIIWAKFIAVFTCVTVGCASAILIGIAADYVRGQPLTGGHIYDILKSNVSMLFVIALSTAGGTFVGVVSKTIVVAVLLVFYGSQNLAIIPMIPFLFGVPELFWHVMVVAAVVALVTQLGAAVLFRRAQY